MSLVGLFPSELSLFTLFLFLSIKDRFPSIRDGAIVNREIVSSGAGRNQIKKKKKYLVSPPPLLPVSSTPPSELRPISPRESTTTSRILAIICYVLAV